jgi:hypothetical protein
VDAVVGVRRHGTVAQQVVLGASRAVHEEKGLF